MLALVLASTLAFGQKEVTKFLGIPVDGTKAEMRQKLISKGFEYHTSSSGDYFTGEFNGRDVMIRIVTNNNKVWRIAIFDQKNCSESQIKTRYNTLIEQFKNNKRYEPSVATTPIPEDEHISYEMSVNNKEYQTVFYQFDQDKFEKMVDEEFAKNFSSADAKELTDEYLESMKNLLRSTKKLALMDEMFNRTVWFTIGKQYGEYYIIMFYDNIYNQANGDDL